MTSDETGPGALVDRAEFESFYAHYVPYVRAYAARRVGASATDDIVADCFLAAWRRRAELPDDALPWLYRTAYNTIGSHYRTAERWRSLRDRIASEPYGTEIDETDRSVERLRLTGALADLSAADQEILMLADWDGLKNVDIAAILAIPAGAVGVRLHRARRRLRDQLTKPRMRADAQRRSSRA